MRYLGRHAVKLGLVCCLLQFVACDRGRQPYPEVMDELHRIEQQTVPPGGRLLRTPVTTLGASAVHADWQIEISSTNPEYFRWVRRQMETEYHLISQTSSELVLGRTDPGDAYVLELTSGSSSPESVIQAHFTAGSD